MARKRSRRGPAFIDRARGEGVIRRVAAQVDSEEAGLEARRIAGFANCSSPTSAQSKSSASLKHALKGPSARHDSVRILKLTMITVGTSKLKTGEEQ